jgi:hypothetical protein
MNVMFDSKLLSHETSDAVLDNQVPDEQSGFVISSSYDCSWLSLTKYFWVLKLSIHYKMVGFIISFMDE